MNTGVIFDNNGSSGSNQNPQARDTNQNGSENKQEDPYVGRVVIPEINENNKDFSSKEATEQTENSSISSSGNSSQNSSNDSNSEEPLHPTIRNEIFIMLQRYAKGLEYLKNDSTPIHVDEIASRLARVYEKIRKIVDWQEDNVLRRRAIERILKRMLFAKISGIAVYQKADTSNLSETITKELIRGGHLPNNQIPREVVPVVSEILNKYLFFLKNSSLPTSPIKDIKKQMNFTTFVIEIAACEIEEILANPIKEYILLDTMTDIMESHIKLVPSNALTDEEKRKQIYIATCRTLLDFDNAYILYRLLDFEYSDWSGPKEETLPKRFNEVVEFWQNSEKLLGHPLAKDFKRICEQNDTIFTLIGDLLTEMKDRPEELINIFEEKESYINTISELYDRRRQTLKKRLFRLGVFSTLSVFLSNWFTFFIVEVPLAHLFYEKFSLRTAFLDFLIPTIVMFILVIIIRPPKKANRNAVVEAVKSFTYKNEKKKFFEIQANRKNRPILKAIFGLLYLFMIWLVFTVVGTSFYIAKLPLTSVVFDTFTIALTVFAAVVIRNKSKELNIGDKTSFFEFVLDMISVPMAKVGAFLAAKWKEYNVVAIFFNFVVEAPFSLILDTIEGWSQYLKDRKAELD